MESFTRGELAIEASLTGDTGLLVWRGASDERTPGDFLDPYLEGIVESLAGKKCRVDLTQLVYMNSASVSPLMRFIKELDKAGITTEVVFSKEVSWQQLSYRAISAVSLRLNHLTTIAV